MREAPRYQVALLGLLLAVLVAGCGLGPATNEEKISKTATTYLNALAEDDTATACAQLTARARDEACAEMLEDSLARLDPEALKSAAHDSMRIDVDGNRATAGLAEPEGAELRLVKALDQWRIDSGYTLP
jgi:hypothetical protein